MQEKCVQWIHQMTFRSLLTH